MERQKRSPLPRRNTNARRAVALLARLEKYTQELTVLYQQVIRLTEEFNRKWKIE